MSKDEKRDSTLTMRSPSRIKSRLKAIKDRDGVSIADIIVPFLDGVIDAYEKRRGGK